MEEDDLDTYFIGDYTIEHFNMTNQSGTYDRRDGVNDYETYQDLLNAMETMGFSIQEQSDITTVTCALLHPSNLTLTEKRADESEIDRDNSFLPAALSLLGTTEDSLNRALCYFSITAGREKHIRSYSKAQAEKGLLILIKATFGALFTHIVKRVNDSITLKKTGGRSNRNTNDKSAVASIGVLDIFGFEIFQFNSFEQLCINYCNEALQQQFNMFVLKNEQDEYEREGIQWSFISFPDNQDVLDLIDKKGTGILNILDDQCRAPGTTDKTFINDLYQKLSRHTRFKADYRQVGARKFAIVHYAGTVEYESDSFVEKNRD
jgi:myosin-5